MIRINISDNNDKMFKQGVLQITNFTNGIGAATPKVRHSEGPPFRRIETKLGLQVGLA